MNKSKNQNKQLIIEFAENGRGRLSVHTVRSYCGILRKAEKLLSQSFCDCTVADVEAIVSMIVRNGTLGVSALHCTHTALRTFYAFLQDTGRVRENPVAIRKGRPRGECKRINLNDFGVTDTDQMITRHGQTYSMVALSSLLLAISPGFVNRVAKSTDAQRQAWQNEEAGK